ncbi:MAG: hypothetical protein KGL39_40840 [Patescibacteria group bacterium]|nr:hypothetical protein [Patescibacteria group bacterium]
MWDEADTVRDTQARAMICARLQGGSIRDCLCRLSHEGGWLECPPEARKPLPKVSPAIIASMADNSATALRATLAGEFCHSCGSPNMIRTGTCLTCRDCGDSSGGCS